jgi:hypothetical protein
MYLINRDGLINERLTDKGYFIWSITPFKIFGIKFYLLHYAK